MQLPIIEIAGITEIQNHSSIWIFYDEQEGDETAILNKNNKIINTHWIFNIDKRLTMKTVVPHLSAMQENRDKDSMHKKGDMLGNFLFGGSDFVILFQDKAGFELNAPEAAQAATKADPGQDPEDIYEHILMGEAYGVMKGTQ